MAYNKEYTMGYLSKLKEIRFRVKPEEYAEMENAAKQMGYKSMRQFFLAAIKELMEKGGKA